MDCLAEGFTGAGWAVEDKIKVLREDAVKKHDGLELDGGSGYLPYEVVGAKKVFFELGEVMFEE